MLGPEAKLATRGRTRLKKEFPGIFIRKIKGDPRQSKGIPDWIVVWQGIAIFMEWKVPRGKTSALQEKTIKEIRAAGGVALVVTSAKQAYNVVRKVEKNVRLGKSPHNGLY